MAATSFNGTNILATATAVDFQIGSGTTANDTITVTPTDMSADADVTAVTGGDITSAANAKTAVDDIDAAMDTINTQRATWGAAQNRFESVIGNLQVAAENTTAARSRIVDADFSAETASLTRAQILQQAGTAMLSQANQVPQQVLQLLPR